MQRQTSKVSKMDDVLASIRKIEAKLSEHDYTIPKEELDILELSLKEKRKEYTILANAEVTKNQNAIIKRQQTEGKVCPNCDGQGGWDISVPCSPNEVMWVDDGQLMTIGYEKCSLCKGIGRVTKKRIKEVEKQRGR